MPVSRRDALRLLAAPVGLAALGVAPSGIGMRGARSGARLKVLVAGGHPDDPESGCGGAMARYADAGHEVVALYLTRGEAGIEGATHADAARIRTAESERACRILGARPVFFGQVDGDTRVDRDAYAAMREVMEREKPDLIFTHWPVDTHPDHRAASLLVYDAWMRMGRKVPLAYFEVLTGEQTEVFRPTDYVDITAVARRKRDACFAHASQKPEEWYPVHERMGRFRGMEHGCEAAEAFVRHDAGPAILPP
ncbi:MAG: PIG-L family deacetylase [Gemmatimonadaceae bacterium]|nr:PIG-L family deacetylase [Gemmatimonadaceae bacterium]NUQ92484.1 PIG-L family deacetylase [Gemmatimonadaceae bacterium]NUR19994.1 PIG-L family deacetylase [Gemmatimonadaceae bacterium]NUS97630.1 PIG-L family deacetylase [Gemmatimonadaceae bacterium]